MVPEINADAARKSDKKLIANPNCTTAIALMALAPLHKEFGIKRCIMSTYQAASGAGAPGMRELEEGSAQFVKGEKVEHSVFAHQLPFNVIPHIDKFLDDKYTKEERKVTWETRKIMDLPDLPVSCTCVRIPTLRAHGESITIETEKPINMERAYAVLNEASGVVVVDDTSKNLYPMPITASTKFDVEVGCFSPPPFPPSVSTRLLPPPTPSPQSKTSRPSSSSLHRSAASASTTSSARTASTCSSSATSSSAARRSTPSSSRRQSCKPVCTRAAARAVYLPPGPNRDALAFVGLLLARIAPPLWIDFDVHECCGPPPQSGV